MNILVINCGSSSLKYELFDLGQDRSCCEGAIERIGEPGTAVRDHRQAFAAMLETLRKEGQQPMLERLDAIGHRVVHGGERFVAPVRIDEEVLAAIRALTPLAPLHNPANVLGIESCRELFPHVPQVAVFDTAFHHAMPAHAYRYALPEHLYTEHGVRRYGFHGSSHAFVLRRVAQHLRAQPDQLNLISLHLGNGASAAAIRAGRSIDTSMGMTPLEGLVMGTRSGDIDPSLPFYIARATDTDAARVETLLNHDSGMKGLCGSNDMREVLARAGRNDQAARLALEIYCYRIRKYIGAYYAVLGRLDALVFTGGVGENAPAVRAQVCEGLDALGIHLDLARSESAQGEVCEVQAAAATVAVLVVRTDEEREIAEQVRELLAPAG